MSFGTLDKIMALLREPNGLEQAQQMLPTLTSAQLDELSFMVRAEHNRSRDKANAVRKKLRPHERGLELGRDDLERLKQVVRWLSLKLYEGFANIYANPQPAAQACWQYEQQHGVAAAAERLRQSPQRFGALRGWGFLGLRSPTRQRALNALRNFDYKGLRDALAHGQKVGQDLQRYVGPRQG